MSDAGGGSGSSAPAEGAPQGGVAAVAEALGFLEAIFDASPAGIALLIGPELRYAKVNPAYRALCPDPGLDPVGQRVEDVWPAPGVCRWLSAALATGRPADERDVPVSTAGRTRWFAFHVRPLTHHGAPAALVVLWETTAAVESRWVAEAAAEEALRQAATLEAIVSAIPDGLLVMDGAGGVLRMNPTAAELIRRLGLDPRTVNRAALERLALTGQDGAPVPPERWPLGRALAGETVRGEHLRVAGASGSPPLWLLVSAAPLRGLEGTVTGLVANLADETSLHALEEARDDLVRMVSHDLRTPLNAVYTQAHLLQRPGEAPAKVQERARSIERSCERMTSMIQDLVEATLLESGQLPLSRAPVDLAAFLPEVLERMRGALDIDRVRVELQAGTFWAELDVARVERIVVNLVSNALKYSSDEVRVRLEEGPLGTVVLSVSDRGVGIAPEDQRRIFERFYRARGGRRPEGLGLGLYIARLLAEAHGGRVEVQSALGQGSTFRLIVPGASPAHASAPPP